MMGLFFVMKVGLSHYLLLRVKVDFTFKQVGIAIRRRVFWGSVKSWKEKWVKLRGLRVRKSVDISVLYMHMRCAYKLALQSIRKGSWSCSPCTGFAIAFKPVIAHNMFKSRYQISFPSLE